MHRPYTGGDNELSSNQYTRLNLYSSILVTAMFMVVLTGWAYPARTCSDCRRSLLRVLCDAVSFVLRLSILGSPLSCLG